MGTKISELSAVATLLGTDEIPLRRSAGNAKFTPTTLVEYLNTQGFGGFGDWSLVTGNPAVIDLSTNDRFVVSVESAGATTITVSNPPYFGYEFMIMIVPQIDVTSITLGSGFDKQFGVTLPINLTAFKETWVRCVWAATEAYYEIIPETPAASGTAAQLYTFDVTIPSADVLTSNATPYALPNSAPPSGFFRQWLMIEAYVIDGGTYATNTDAVIRYAATNSALVDVNLSLTDAAFRMKVATGVQINDLGSGLQFFTTIGNPTAGTDDIRVIGTYSDKPI